jgi:hypothetical protein
MDTIKSPFTATATATGGRNGHTEANDGSVRADLGSKKAATDCREVMHKRQITVAVVDDDPNILDSASLLARLELNCDIIWKPAGPRFRLFS